VHLRHVAVGQGPSQEQGLRCLMCAITGNIAALMYTLSDMSRKDIPDRSRSDVWLTRRQLRAWLAFMRVQQRLGYEMNRQLQADDDLSLADYDVLNALTAVPDERMQVGALAARIGWERSRLSHHAKRMQNRGLVQCELAASDRRATEIRLTAEGRRAIVEAAPGHVDLVRHLFFGGLPKELLGPMTQALEAVCDNIVEHGTLPAPASEP
jgi:DNA-binding MarR family transcriptional regulator